MKEYEYTAEWKGVRGILTNGMVRGVIAQELHKSFLEYVTILPNMSFPEKKKFILTKFL